MTEAELRVLAKETVIKVVGKAFGIGGEYPTYELGPNEINELAYECIMVGIKSVVEDKKNETAQPR